MITNNYLYGAKERKIPNDGGFHMSEQTKKIVRAVSTGVTICGVVGLFISGATEVEVSNAVKVGTMIAAIVGSIITTLLPKK